MRHEETNHSCRLIDHYLTGEPGLYFLIETDDRKILFNTSYSDVFIRNAQKMEISLFDLDMSFDFEHVDPGKLKIVMQDWRTEPDQLRDDSALACRTPEGLVIVTGCSHADICNIVEYARKVCRDDRVRDVIGGLHLRDPGAERLEKTCRHLGSLGLEALHACHCTSLSSKIALAGYCPVQEVGSGMKLEWYSAAPFTGVFWQAHAKWAEKRLI